MSNSFDSLYREIEEELEGLYATDTHLKAKNVWEWVQKYRSNVGDVKRNFNLIPFWKEFYLDPHMAKGAVCGRQVYKSTAATDYLAYTVTIGSFRIALYVIHDPDSLEAFSTERVREGTFQANSLLANFLHYGKRAAVKTIKLINHSRIYFRHSQKHYKNTEGLTAHTLILDEIQKQDLTKLRIAKHTIRVKKAPLIMFGIGAEEGSSFHDLLMTEADIYDWVYDDKSDYIDPVTKKVWPKQGWRNKLKFDKNGNITNTPAQLKKILAGKLVKIHSAINEPLYKFYHFPQEIFAEIPLTISDCKKYDRSIDDSIEYQKIHESEDLYQAHCMGWFYAGRGKPLTLAMIKKCYKDHIGFLTPNEIKLLKEKYKNELVVTAGVDWGSNKTGKSNTVFTVLLCFKKTRYMPAHFQIAYQKVFDIERTDAEEAVDIIPLVKQYHVDHATADLGFGKSGVKIMQEALGYSKVKGVFTLGNLLEETHTYEKDVDYDEKKFGINNPYLKVHKTERVDALVGIIKSSIGDITDPTNKQKAQPKLVIPHENPLDVDTLENGLLKIKRADLEDDMIVTREKGDKRQHPEKLYEHYADEVSALIHAFIAFDNYKGPDAFMPKIINHTKSGFLGGGRISRR